MREEKQERNGNSLLRKIGLGAAGLGMIVAAEVGLPGCIGGYDRPPARGAFARNSCECYTFPPGSPDVEKYDFTPSVLRNYTNDGKGVLHTEVGVGAKLYGLAGRKASAEIVMISNERGEPVDRNSAEQSRGLMSMETVTIPVSKDGERISFTWEALFLGKYQVIWSTENGREIGRSEFIVRQR